ncbi:hypothetical protein DITRI_Ditri17bG0101400 [Diplodiscus trichospermus]
MKINCDGSFKQEIEQAGTRVILRDHKGKVSAGSNIVFAADSTLVAEAYALKEGGNLALQSNLQQVEIETDSSIVFSEITNCGRTKHWKI